MLELQCAQRFPARPADPDSSVFSELFPAPQPEPSQPNVPAKHMHINWSPLAKHMHINWSPLSFMSDLSTNKLETCFPPDVWQAFFCRSFGAPIPKMLAHAHSRTLCSCKMCIDPLGEDYVLTCKQHTGSIRSHNHLMDLVASLSPRGVTPRSVLCVSITRCRRRAMALASRVTLKSLTSPSLSGMVLSLMFPLCVSSRVAAVHLGGRITVCAILMTSYRPVPMSRTTNTRTFMGSLQGVCTCHRRYVWSDPR